MENLEKLIKKTSFNGCDDILLFLKDELESKVQELKIFGDKTKIFLAGINTKLCNIEPIVLAGHIDTVAANVALYQTNPYQLTIVDGKGYGLGTIDMKSFTAIIMDNLALIKKCNVPVVLALTTDEETELKSIKMMIDKFKELKIKPKFTILGEPTKSEFNLSANASFEYKVKFIGKSCHSGKMSDGINAICACAKLISMIETRQKAYRLTSNCGKIVGGEVVNKVPDYAELLFDIRSTCQEDVTNFLEEINYYILKLKQEYSGLVVEFEETLSIPAFNMTNNQKIKAIANRLGIKISHFQGSCEAGYYTAYSGDAVIFGVGDLSLSHKPNEYVEIKEYNVYSNQLIDVIEKIKELYF